MKSTSHLIMGSHAIEEVYKHSPERLLCVYYVKLSSKAQDRRVQLIRKLENSGVKLKACSPKELDHICNSTSHQGIAGSLKERKKIDLDSFFKTHTSKLVVVLDSICDPHNLGAILRACECFDVGLVVWSKNRGAKITPVVTKTSSSATEFVPIHIVSNLSTTIDKFIENGFTIIGAQCTEKAQNVFKYSFPDKTVLILGSEGEGLRELLQKKLDVSLSIPMYGKIDSLNVSQAAALMIGLWKSKQA